MICTNTINALIDIYKGDEKFLDIIERSIGIVDENIIKIYYRRRV